MWIEKNDEDHLNKNLPLNKDPNSYIQLKQFQDKNKTELYIKKWKDITDKENYSNTMLVSCIDIHKSQQYLKSNFLQNLF